MSQESPHPDTEFLQTHYYGSIAMFAERQLKQRGVGLRFGVKHEQRWRDGRLIHRATDIQTGASIEVAERPAVRRGYFAPQVLEFRAALKRASGED